MDIRITTGARRGERPADEALGFGALFSEHLFAMDYSVEAGWHDARVEPRGDFRLDPAAAVFHYGQAMFEGCKAFRGVDGRVRLFRPDLHARRMVAGAPRLCMQAPSEAQMLSALRALVQVDVDWVPGAEGTSLYLRPTLIATEPFLGVRPSRQYRYFIIASPAGSYFGGAGLTPVRIWVERRDVRAPRGGLGATKAAANYVASLASSVKAQREGYDQVLWLDGQHHEYVEEVGTMNVCFVIGGALVTPSLSDSILAGVTRDSVLTLARERGLKVEERPVSLSELVSAHRGGHLTEVFGTGTAAVITPVGELALGEERLVIGDGAPGPLARAFSEDICAMQRGLKPDRFGWLVEVA